MVARDRVARLRRWAVRLGGALARRGGPRRVRGMSRSGWAKLEAICRQPLYGCLIRRSRTVTSRMNSLRRRCALNLMACGGATVFACAWLVAVVAEIP